MAGVTRPKVGALVSAVAAMSCNGAPSATGPQPPVAAPTVAVGPASGAPSGRAVRTVPAQTEVHDDSLEGRLSELRARDEWQRFEKLWRELDAVVPASAPGGGSYERCIDSDRSRDLSSRMVEQVRALEQGKLLSTDEAAFFRRMASTRIENMTYGSMRLMTSHRAPMPFEWDRFRSVDRLEQRIDVLEELRAKGRVEQPEYRLALEQVEREAVTLYVLQELQRFGRGVDRVGPKGVDGERMLAEMEQRIAAAKADGGAPEEHLVELVKRSKILLPAVRALLAELEQ